MRYRSTVDAHTQIIYKFKEIGVAGVDNAKWIDNLRSHLQMVIRSAKKGHQARV